MGVRRTAPIGCYVRPAIEDLKTGQKNHWEAPSSCYRLETTESPLRSGSFS